MTRLDDKSPSTSRLVSGTPVRRIGLRRRSVRGAIEVRGQPVEYESTLERDLLILLDFDPTVAQAIGQPVRFDFSHPVTGRRTHYTPDIYARHEGGRPREILYECKYRGDLWEDFHKLKHGFKAARRAALEHGMTHRIVTEVEIRGPFLDNATFLRRYLRIEADSDLEERLAATLATLGPATPQALVAAAFWAEENQAQAIPHLWRMVATGRILADLQTPLTMSSPIAIVLGGGYTWTDPYTFP